MSPAIRAGLGTGRSGWFLIRLPWLPRARNPQPLCMSTAIQALQPEDKRLESEISRVKDVFAGDLNGRIAFGWNSLLQRSGGVLLFFFKFATNKVTAYEIASQY